MKKTTEHPMWQCPVIPLDLNKNLKTTLPEWEVKITKVENGYIMSYKEDISSDERNEFKITREVFENDNDKDFISTWDEVDKSDISPEEVAMSNLLHSVKEYFGCYYDKYKKVNLVIKFEKENYEN